MGRKKTKNYYWTEDTEQAIIQYNSGELNEGEKNKLYNDEIEYPFNKLAENIINTFKFTYFDDVFKDVQHEVVVFLIMNMHKYDHTKGSKAFSYFSVVAKNYLILNNNNNYKKLKLHMGIETLNYKHDDKNYTDTDELAEEVIRYFDKRIATIFKKRRDMDVAYAIVELFKRREEIENFNKKSLYILIREMTNVDTNHITKVVNVMRKKYKILLNEYASSGLIVTEGTGSKFFK